MNAIQERCEKRVFSFTGRKYLFKINKTTSAEQSKLFQCAKKKCMNHF